MESWGNWILSSKTEERLSQISSQLKSDKCNEISKVWLKIYNYGSPPITEDSIQDIEIDTNEGEKKEIEIIASIKESLESNEIFPDTQFIGLSYNSINKILVSLTEGLTQTEFSNLCKCISTWENNFLVEESLRLIVLPKLKEKAEASSCIIFSTKNLAANKPDSFCNNVFIPLLTDESFQFTDIELLGEVFPVLKVAQQDLIIMSLTNKENFQENDWLLLQPLCKNSSQNSIINIINCICKFSYKFPKSQIFGRFLVNFLKSLDFITNRESLLKAINKHETLFKKQAVKYLMSIWDQEL